MKITIKFFDKEISSYSCSMDIERFIIENGYIRLFADQYNKHYDNRYYPIINIEYIKIEEE